MVPQSCTIPGDTKQCVLCKFGPNKNNMRCLKADQQGHRRGSRACLSQKEWGHFSDNLGLGVGRRGSRPRAGKAPARLAVGRWVPVTRTRAGLPLISQAPPRDHVSSKAKLSTHCPRVSEAHLEPWPSWFQISCSRQLLFCRVKGAGGTATYSSVRTCPAMSTAGGCALTCTCVHTHVVFVHTYSNILKIHAQPEMHSHTNACTCKHTITQRLVHMHARTHPHTCDTPGALRG